MNGIVAQLLACNVASLAAFSSGITLAWSTAAVQKLEAPDSTLDLTSSQISFMMSIVGVGALIGPVIISFLINRIGRKWSLTLTHVPTLASFLIIGFGNDYTSLCIGRVLAGVGMGFTLTVLPMYLTEIAEDEFRGAAGSVLNFQLNAGSLIPFGIGPWVSLKTLSAISCIPEILYFLLFFFFMPESPYYYLMKDNRTDAEKSLKWLRARDDVKDELNAMDRYVKKMREEHVDVFSVVRDRGNRRAFLICLSMFTFLQFGGVMAIQTYESSIFLAAGSAIDENLSILISGITLTMAGIISIFLVDVAGRRLTLFVTDFATTCFLLSIAIFFHLKTLDYDVSAVNWLPLVATIGFLFAVTVGPNCISFVFAGELFPTNAKALANTVIAIYSSVTAAVIIPIFQVIRDNYGFHVAFYGFTAISLSSFGYAYFFVPETKGHSFQEIRDKLSGRKTVPSSPDEGGEKKV